MEGMYTVEEKWLIHISHLHPLKLVTSPEPKPTCHACYMRCASQSYGCNQCNYFLHITCATTKQSMNHPSHPHTLKFELTRYPDGRYLCDACGVRGNSFCLRCRECKYDLHLPCAALPHTVNHRSHHHPLNLLYKNPNPPKTTATCDVCNKNLDVNRWLYLCKSCDFGGHVGCFSSDKLAVSLPNHPAPHARPPAQGPQPQPHEAAQVCTETNTLHQLEMQLTRAQMENIEANIHEETRTNMDVHVKGAVQEKLHEKR